MRLIMRFIPVWLLCFPLSAQENPHLNLQLFQHSENCIACHSNLVSASGQDVSIGYSWRASMMANSARDPYWHAGVRREVMDHPQAQAAIEDKCSTCHMPMSRYQSSLLGETGKIFENLLATNTSADKHLAMDGVSCSVCHQIEGDNFGEPSSFTGGFQVDTTRSGDAREIYGPYDIERGRQVIMQSSAAFLPTQGQHIQQSELCATCHTLFTHALDNRGVEVGQLAEQVPYLEWLFSDYRESNSCQSCHMPQLNEAAPISSVVGDMRDEFSQHVFRGGNAFMLGIFAKYGEELGVTAPLEEFARTRDRTIAYLETSSAALELSEPSVADGKLMFSVQVSNLAGHKLPTAYPSRRSWLHVTVKDAGGRTVFESGAFNADGSIQGNDGDRDQFSYEPHHQVISRADQVQIYEPVMVDYAGQVTTGLLYGVRYTKDNRLLPRGFDKQTANPDIAVYGDALNDADFNPGGDSVRFEIPAPSADTGWQIEVELLYQSIGYRWAKNLEDYDSQETNLFTRLYRAEAAAAAITLARAVSGR